MISRCHGNWGQSHLIEQHWLTEDDSCDRLYLRCARTTGGPPVQQAGTRNHSLRFWYVIATCFGLT